MPSNADHTDTSPASPLTDRERIWNKTGTRCSSYGYIYLLIKNLILAERVGFEPLLVIENKELKGFCLPHDPPDPHKSLGRDTY
jgi:hypothetical protein